MGLSVFLHVLIVKLVWRVDLRNEKHMIDAVVYSLGEFFGITNKLVLHLFHLTVVIDLVEFDILASLLPLCNILLDLKNLSFKVFLGLLFAWRHLTKMTF